MRSHTTGHFPQIRFFDGQKWLFNPILKKRFANRPEERVRLQYVEFLLRETAVTKNRIGFEALVKAYARDNSLRADLVIYDQEIAPMALIECKSGRIKLNEKTAEQAARYNLTLQADYMMITNGRNDFWYKKAGETVSAIQHHPFDLSETSLNTVRTADYWTNRGFLDSALPDELSECASRFLNVAFGKADSSASTYLNLPPDIAAVPLSHFYHVVQHDQNNQLAVSLTASPGQTVFAAMLNRNGENRGVLWLPLRDFLESEKPEARLLSPAGISRVRIPGEAVTHFRNPSISTIKKLINHLIILFD